MSHSTGGEGPAVLQLQKWGPSSLQFDLSEFHEAFISPTRELLLLLSYQCQALLLPLITGNFVDIDSSTRCSRENHLDSDSPVLLSEKLPECSGSDPSENVPSTSGSAVDLGDGFSSGNRLSKADKYPILCDVNSLAWGACGDTYNQHNGCLFREFLFVSGKQGVMVHAFCYHGDTSAVANPAFQDDSQEGRWVQWGPLPTGSRNMVDKDPTSLSFGTPGDVLCKNNDDGSGNREAPNKSCKKSDNDYIPGTDTSKRWLQSFLTKVETRKYEGCTWTRFPEKSSFPPSAKVVSFGIFDDNFPVMGFIGQQSGLNESIQHVAVNLENVSCYSESPSSTVSVDHPYKCVRVFSSNSHQLLGFVLMVYRESVVTEVSKRNRSKNVVIVARIDVQGIQWTSCVKLDESVNDCDWSDFCFSNDLLVCLNASGLIFFYDAVSGEFVASLDVALSCGLNGLSVSRKIDGPVDAFLENKTIYQDDLSCSRRKFRRLLLASYTSLLGVVDDLGVVYVISAGEHVPDKYYTFEKFLPHYKHLGLGMLVGWKVAGSDIGSQRIYSKTLQYTELDTLFKSNGCLSTLSSIISSVISGTQSREEECLHDLFSNDFSSLSRIYQKFHDYQRKFHLMRKVFFPVDRVSDSDSVCFSPFGITRLVKRNSYKEQNAFHIVHFNMHVGATVHDDWCVSHGSEGRFLHGGEETSIGKAVGGTFQGLLYLVTEHGLSVVLPSVSIAPDSLPVESIGYRQLSICLGAQCHNNSLDLVSQKRFCSSSKVEILDRVLLYDGPEEADRLCLENGWDLKIARMRRLQMALDYLKFDEIKPSLEGLVEANIAEEGILRLLFASAYLMFKRNSNDSEISAASRLLGAATWFATKMIRKYGFCQQKEGGLIHDVDRISLFSLPQAIPDKSWSKMGYAVRLQEIAHYLEIVRNLQHQLRVKLNKPSNELVVQEELSFVDHVGSQDEHQLSMLSGDHLEMSDQLGFSLSESASRADDYEMLALFRKGFQNSEVFVTLEDSSEASAIVPQGIAQRNKVLPLENPKDMIARWKINKLDLKTVVKDALLSGRLPLAVLQLHLHRSREFLSDEEAQDTFTEVSDIGRAIAYDLFLKGEIGLAIATLQRLGEDVEVCLKELVFGTLRRSVRAQIAEEMIRYGYLGPRELKILERISVIERSYPSSSFWQTFIGRQHDTSVLSPPEGLNLQLLDSHLFNSLMIECGEVDGVVLGSWRNISEYIPDAMIDQDGACSGYWAAAAVWSSAWDQRTIDRILLDQPFLMGVHVLWESQVEYHLCHSDWEEVSKLLDFVPVTVLSEGSLQVALDGVHLASTVRCISDFPDDNSYICSAEQLDAVCMDIPDVKFIKLSPSVMCSSWLGTLLETLLAKKFIFLKEFWEGTGEIVFILARSGFVADRFGYGPTGTASDLRSPFTGENLNVGTLHALDKLVVYHCVQNNLPNFLEVYLDHHKLALDDDSLSSLLDTTGDCHWARWLLLSRIKGHEYDASFENTRTILSHNSGQSNNLQDMEVNEIIHTIDDIAEGGGEMAALATLMYAPAPIQDCLKSGSVNRHCSSSAQCTLENLRPTLQHFPTLWRSLLAACFGQDTAFSFLGSKAKTALSDYLNWRDSIFFSSGHDTSLLQMLPCWFPKAVRRLVQLYIQGPLGWQSISPLPTGECLLNGDVDFYLSGGSQTEINAISWEATIQKHVKEELYDSSLEETRIGLEHHLYRGRALAAFNHLLALRVENLKVGRPSTSAQVQNNVQSDVQTLLASITQSEESLLASVLPLAITHFEDSVLVASCNLLMELCGLSTNMLQVDIAALRRIAIFYKSSEYKENVRQLSPKGPVFHAVQQNDVMESLARALADEYLHQDSGKNSKQKELSNSVVSRQHSRALMLVLQHLEKASLPSMVDGPTCGSWLLTGQGDGAELRSQQKAASQHWSLVTMFCRMHQLPLSTKYLAVLARDNDWVGYLYEAQTGGHPFDSVVQVASKEFSDPRLKIHIMTVLNSMEFRRKVGSSSYSDATTVERSEISIPEENVYIPVELFRILAACEKQNSPGEALLIKAKELSWSILAMIASCFPDVPPLSCLTVWLEITAARETSSIKVNNIASQISDNIAAAVESTNSLPVSSKAVVFHYNRRNPKRRRLMDPVSVSTPSDKKEGLLGGVANEGVADKQRIAELGDEINLSSDSKLEPASLSEMVAVLCQQRLFLPLLRAFEMFLPSCSLLPFIRALQAFSQMRLSEASAHLGSFSARIKEDQTDLQANIRREGHTGTSWISSIAVKAADAMLLTCPSPYEKRCLLQLLAATDFGDGGCAATYYRRLHWKINLAEPSLRKNDYLHLGNEQLDDASLLSALQNNRQWEQAHNWAKQLEASGGPWKSISHHVTETQAESMVAEWKEFLWDVPEERVALWAHCQTLFIRYSFPALRAGLFFLKHAEAVEKDLPAKELHGLLLLSLQWLSGVITHSNPVYPLHHLREIETRVWLLAVESEAQMKNEGELSLAGNGWDPIGGNISNIIDRTANIIMKMDNHMNIMRSRAVEKFESRDTNQGHSRNQAFESNYSTAVTGNMKTKRRAKGFAVPRRAFVDATDRTADFEDVSNLKTDLNMQDESVNIETSFSKWEERVGPAEVERAVLSLLEFGQIAAAKQLQQKLSPGKMPSELVLVDAALKLAAMPGPITEVPVAMLDAEVRSVIQSYNIVTGHRLISPLAVLESLATFFTEGSGQGLCKKIISVVRAANILGISFSEAFGKQPVELLQLLSLKAQESFDEAKLLVQSNAMPASSIASILAESFLKGLLAAHRGGYMDSQKDEGPAPLLWRFSDFLKWAELCPSEPEIGHALMRLVITGQEIPHACEVELLILSHHFYKSSACLDGVDVLVALAATRVEAYVSEGDFPCLARLITGVGNFHALNFILNILIENGQLDLLLQKYSAAADTNTGTAEAVRGFRMAVLTSLKQFNPNDLDAFALVYSHFDMKHETAALLELRANRSSHQWFQRHDRDQNEDLLESMRCFIEAAEVHSSIDAGNKTRRACAQASLVSLQIRMPDSKWIYLSETNARRALVDQSRFQEALIVAEAYCLNQPSEWALVLWNLMLNPELTEEFVAEFVAVLPLQPSMLVELAKFYRAEVAARGDQSQFSVWLTGGGLPAEWAKYLGRSFRCLLKRTRDVRLRLQLATIATGFTDVANACSGALDKVPENAGPLVLRKGHGGAYLPLM